MPRHTISPDPDYAAELRSILLDLEDHRQETTGIAQKVTEIDEAEQVETAYSIATVEDIIQQSETALQYGNNSAIIFALETARAALSMTKVDAVIAPIPSRLFMAIENNYTDEAQEYVTALIKDMETRLEGEIGEQLRLVASKIEETDTGWGADDADGDLATLRSKFEQVVKEYATNNSMYTACLEEIVNSSVFASLIPNITHPSEEPFSITIALNNAVNAELESGKYDGMMGRAIVKATDALREYIGIQYTAISRWYERLFEVISAIDGIQQEKIRLTTHEDDKPEDDFEVRMLER